MAASLGTLTALPEPVDVPDTPAARLARGGGWWTLILGLVMLLAMTEALYAAAWSEGLELVRLAVLGGAMLAFVLSLTRWEGLFPAVYSVLASLAWIGTLFHQLIFPGLTRREAIEELVRRNAEWIGALINGTASADNLIFVTQITFLGWWIGYLAIWSLIRHQRLIHAALPTGIAVLVNAYYSTRNLTGFLVVYLAAVLLLAIRLELARNETRWQLTRVRYPPDIVLDFLRAGLVFAVIVLSVAWVLPSAAESLTVGRLTQPLREPWERFEETWNRMYRSLNYGTVAIPVTAFNKTTTLGGPVSLTDRPIFEATTKERTYWRAVAYDTYTGTGWINTDKETVGVQPNEPLGEPRFSRTREITATIRSLEFSQETVFAPPQPMRVSVPVNADYTPVPGPEERRAISLLRSRVDLAQYGPYQVTSAVSDASPDRLRADKTEYPAWARDRYLQLPEDLPARIRDLAARITEPYDNPYDKADALEKFLRTYTYNQQIAAPPPGADGVDYFLFDVQQGYCDYYASAMAVMLRSVGVPARYVIGYTPGQPLNEDEQLGPQPLITYRVLERNAHAWVEVFFPSYGWVQFEPTASEPLLPRPTPEPTPGPEDDTLGPDIRNLRNERDQPLLDDFAGGLPPEDQPVPAAPAPTALDWRPLAVALALVALIGGGWWAVRARRAALFRDSAAALRLFGLIGVWAGRLKIPWQASQTPLERATAFAKALPEAASVVRTIADLFVAQQYGRQQPPAETLASTVEAWLALQPVLWQRWLLGVVYRRLGLAPVEGM
ncbi:MAG: DUF3488 and transglutaminase-like domain-containing protein [Anaerolineae bacterium]|nr:DUF3488 and transglutaminase-like domain-containing protein [Anaerolineae bacterium]